MSGDEMAELAASGLATDDRLGQVAEWLRKLLGCKRLPSSEVMEEARKAQIPIKLLYAAKKPAHVRAVHDGTDGRWFWELDESGAEDLSVDEITESWIKYFRETQFCKQRRAARDGLEM